jgi:acetyl esterase/lipase
MRYVRFVVPLLALILVVRAPLITIAQEATPTPPAAPPSQPATGPGGSEVAYDGILAQHYGPHPDGMSEPSGYWLFEPTGPRSDGTPVALQPLPLVIFLHGFTVVDPEVYHVWIEHLVRRGTIVVFPDYQAANVPFSGETLVATDLSAPQAIQDAIRAAVRELASGDHAQPDLTQVTMVGHSLGALLAADYAGRATPDLPAPAALLLVVPGCLPDCDVTQMAQIPATTRVLVLVGNQDTLAGEDTAKLVWAELGQIPADHKDYVHLRGDDHGQPPLVADHFIPLTTTSEFAREPIGALNAYDWFGTWKWLDALMSCSAADQDCAVALGNTPEQRFMGAWSDGIPVLEPEVTDDPGLPATSAGTPAA